MTRQRSKIESQQSKKTPTKKVGLIFKKGLDFFSLLLYVVVLTGGTTYEKYDKRAMAREQSIFEYAFKLGMQIAIETLTDK